MNNLLDASKSKCSYEKETLHYTVVVTSTITYQWLEGFLFRYFFCLQDITFAYLFNKYFSNSFIFPDDAINR